MGSSTSQLVLGMVLRFTDQGSTGAIRAINGVQQALNSIVRGGASAANTAARVAQSMQGMGAASNAAGRNLQISGDLLVTWGQRAAGAAAASNSAARGLDGVASSGAAAARGLDRASSSSAAAARGAEQVTNNASAATRALNSMRQAGGVAGGLQGYLSGIAGYTAGKAVLAGPVRETMNYDRNLANVVLTAAPKGASLSQLTAIHKQLNEGVMAAIRPNEGGGGGSRDSALEGLKTLIASGKYKDVNAALKDLKWVQKGVSAFAAQPIDIANLIISGKNIGVSAQRTLEITGASGKDGQFETRNMAKHIPTWIPYAQSYGMNGEQALIEVVTMAQAAMRSAGSPDRAAINVKNALQKLLSNDTVNDAKKLGIDLRGSIAQAVAKGASPPDAFGNLLEQQMVKNPNYQKTLKQLQTATGADKQQALEAMATIYKGAGFSSLIQDMQATAGWSDFLAQRHAKENSTTELRGNAKNSGGMVDENMAYVKTLPSFDVEALAAEKDNAMQTAMDKVNPLLGGMAEWLSAMAKDYPTMAAATWGATTALTALATAAGAASLAQRLGGAGAGAAGGMAQAMLARIGITSLAGAGAAGLAAAGGIAVGTVLHNAIEGTAVGDKVGQMVTELWAFVGSKNAQDALAATRQIEAAQAMKEAAEAWKTARPSVHLDGRQLDAELQDIQNFKARRQ